MGILDLTSSTKDFEVANIWLLASEELIGCFVQKLTDVDTVDDVTCCINSFRPELSWCLVLVEHCSSHLNEGSVPAFNNAILLRCVWSRKLMSDSHCIQIEIKPGVLEFSAVITSDMLDLDAIIVHGSIGEASEDILYFSLVENYVHPSISKVIINNDEAIVGERSRNSKFSTHHQDQSME